MRSVVSRSLSYSSKNSLGNRSVLVVGAGVAGPVLAYFLHRFGVQPVVVERAPQLRTAGQTIDVRGAGREVVRRMGVDSTIREKIAREDGLAFVDSAGRTRVTFASGNIREFDLVIGADGIRSKTRRLVFSDKSPIHYLNMYTAYFTIPYSQSDGTWARWYNAPKGRTVLIRPDNQGTTRAFLSFRSSQRGYEDLDPDMQKELLQKIFADAGFETPRILSGLMNSNDFYFEAIGQVKMDQWSQGRVSLVGDAGYCASPISDMGTSLTFVGAYILAEICAISHSSTTEIARCYKQLIETLSKTPEATDLKSLVPRFCNHLGFKEE
ncbi:unnamed protein product, partial [Didymodactylos carnosus]